MTTFISRLEGTMTHVPDAGGVDAQVLEVTPDLARDLARLVKFGPGYEQTPAAVHAAIKTRLEPLV
jgi:hypothetical protein